MKKFNHVIVRRPCRAMVDGITSAPETGLRIGFKRTRCIH